MLLTQKSQYALRAVFELSRRYGQGPVKAPAIAHAQGIPVRFLEVILNQLKHGRLIEAKRGVSGGYYLLKRPDEISLADVIFFIQGPPRVISKEAGERKKHGKHLNIEAFNHVWKNPEEVCPAKWKPGQKTLKPSEKLVGRVYEALT